MSGRATVTKAHRQLALDMVIAASEAAGDAIPDLAADAVLQGWLETGEAPPEFTLNTAASNAAAQVLADAELRGAEGKAGAWVSPTGEPPSLDSFAWVAWNGVVQQQPWQWVNTDDDRTCFFFDGHQLGMDEVDAYMPIPLPPPPSEAK